jgi:hypothetical protein
MLEEIEGIFSIENDVSLEIPALAPLVFNINNSFCEVRAAPHCPFDELKSHQIVFLQDLTISDVHFAHNGAAGVDCPIVARLLIEAHHFASVWNAFVQGAESAELEEEAVAESTHQQDSMEVDQNEQDVEHVAENSEVTAAQDAMPSVVDTIAEPQIPAVAVVQSDEHTEVDALAAESALSTADTIHAAETAVADAEAALEEADTDAAEANVAEADADGAVEHEDNHDYADDHQYQEQADKYEATDLPAETDVAGGDHAVELAAADEQAVLQLDADSGAHDQMAEELAAEEAAEAPAAELVSEEPAELPELAGDVDADDLPEDLDSGMVEVPDDLGDLEGELEAAEDDSQNLKKRSREDSQNAQDDTNAPAEDSELQESEPKRLKTDPEHIATIEQAVAAN